MTFLLSEVSKPQKHYKIYQKIQNDSETLWKDVALVTSRKLAFYYMTLLEK